MASNYTQEGSLNPTPTAEERKTESDFITALMINVVYKHTEMLRTIEQKFDTTHMKQGNLYTLCFECKICKEKIIDLTRIEYDPIRKVLNVLKYIGKSGYNTGKNTTIHKMRKHVRNCFCSGSSQGRSDTPCGASMSGVSHSSFKNPVDWSYGPSDIPSTSGHVFAGEIIQPGTTDVAPPLQFTDLHTLDDSSLRDINSEVFLPAESRDSDWEVFLQGLLG